MKALGIAIVLALASNAGATPSDRAKATSEKLYTEGQSLYNAGDYHGAAQKFQLAYDTNPDPVYLFNVAQAYRFAKECRVSADSYKRFLSEAPNAPNRDKVQQYIDDMEACARTQAPVEPKPDPKPAVVEPTKPAPEPAPPPEVTADVHAQATPAVHHGHSALTYVLGATGLIALGVGVYFTHDVLDVNSRQDACATTHCDGGTIAALDDEGGRDNVGQLVSYSIAAVALGASAWLYFRHDTDEAPIAVAPTKGGAYVSTGFRF
jgi:hypothetical protein